MPSRWCAGCSEPVSVDVVIARTVVYHEFCWYRRLRVLNARPERLRNGGRALRRTRP